MYLIVDEDDVSNDSSCDYKDDSRAGLSSVTSSAEVSDTVLSPVVPDVSWRTVRRSSSVDIARQGRWNTSRPVSRPGPGLHQGEGEGEEGEEEDQEDGEA